MLERKLAYQGPVSGKFLFTRIEVLLVNLMDFFEVIRNRRSIRKYQNKAVENEKLKRILEAARLAPSAMNRQPYQLFVITNKELLSMINSACNQNWEAPLMIAMIANPKEAWVRDDGEEYWIADAAIAMQHISLAAYNEGLGTCWIVAFNEKEVREILELDLNSRVAFLSPLGYPAEKKGQIRNRKSLDSLVHYK